MEYLGVNCESPSLTTHYDSQDSTHTQKNV